MSGPDRPDILDWCGLRRAGNWGVARWLGRALTVLVIVLFALAVATAFAMLVHAIFDLGLGTPRGGLGTGAVTVALIGAPFVVWRAIVAQKAVDLQEQGHITDRINTAVQGLGAEKTISYVARNISRPSVPAEEREEHQMDEYIDQLQKIDSKTDSVDRHLSKDINYGDWEVFTETKPNLEVRIGAIYALERIAQDSERDHVQIMEILCAYIRENAAREDLSPPDGPQTPKEWVDWAWNNTHPPRLDVDVGLTVISRRSETRKQNERKNDYRLYLEQAPFWGTMLRWLDLSGAYFLGARLQGSLLGEMKLNGASFQAAQLQGAIFLSAELRGTKFGGAKLQGAFFHDVEMDTETEFKDASLDGVALHEVDLTNVSQIIGRLGEMFGDGTVKLPEGCDRPAHWPRRKLEFGEFRNEWHRWLATPNTYTPPE